MGLPKGWKPIPQPTEKEIQAIVHDMPDERLQETAGCAAEHPGTDWDRRLSAEMHRRGLPSPEQR